MNTPVTGAAPALAAHPETPLRRPTPIRILPLLLGLGATESEYDSSSPEYLPDLLRRRQNQVRRITAMRRVLVGCGVFFIVFWFIFSWLTPHKDVTSSTLTLVILSYGAVFIAAGFLPSIKQARQDVEDTLSEIDLRNIALEQRETRAQKLFQLHQVELKRYYDQSLAQGR
jgi:hypothetical protein